MTTTDLMDRARREELARKTARIYGLRDPLGAKGFRVTSPRIERESRARRGVFLAVFACFIASLGLVTLASGEGQDGTAAQPAIGDEHPVTSRSLSQTTPVPHLRTRATP
jgi:hypothetical protein